MDMMFNTEVIVNYMKGGKEDMTETKRFKVHSMIQGMNIGETMDLEVCEELIKKYGSSSDIELFITNNGNNMTYQEVVDLLNENEQLKQALREQLEENGNAYCIEILDKIFNLKYDEWQRKMNETHTYDYIDWEKVLNDKGDV